MASGNDTQGTKGGEAGASRDPRTAFDAERYIEERLGQYQRWYDRKAVDAKTRYLRMRGTAVIGGAIVPVLVNVTLPYVAIVTTALSLLVVIVVSLESVYHYREQWKNYRATEQFLGRERVYFQTGVGPYNELDQAAAFKLLVDRVEAAIAVENAATLNTMTLGGGGNTETKLSDGARRQPHGDAEGGS